MRPKYIDLLTVVFITILITSNIASSKVGVFGGYFFPVGVIGFPLAYVIADVLTEVYGYSAMKRVIWMGFCCNLIAVLFITAARSIPPAPFYGAEVAYDTVLGSTPRLLVASFVAYLLGSFANAAILSRLKVRMHGKFLWVRTISSTLVGEALDSIIFITIAFVGTMGSGDLRFIVFTQWAFKCTFEILVTPLTYLVVRYLKKKEGIDTYDTNTCFNLSPFSHANK